MNRARKAGGQAEHKENGTRVLTTGNSFLALRPVSRPETCVNGRVCCEVTAVCDLSETSLRAES